jgi:large subunit ribosomal protein L30
MEKSDRKKVILIKQIGSLVGCTRRQRETVRGLGLRRMNHVVERLDTPEIRGMVKKVPHLAMILEEERSESGADERVRR